MRVARGRVRQCSLVFSLLCLAVLAPAISSAQATLAGVVKDSSGVVLPGVTVETSSPALIEKIRTATTDGTGQYQIVDLRPGSYSITFSISGFRTAREVQVSISEQSQSIPRLGQITSAGANVRRVRRTAGRL